MNWLTDELREEIRQTFEPYYRSSITDEEVDLIAESLTSYMETFIKNETVNEKLRYGKLKP